LFIFRHIAIVERSVTLLMAVTQQTPFRAWKIQGMRQRLENNVSIGRPKSVPAQRRQSQGVRCVIGQ
jgi:hypothetical protein